MGVIFAEKKTRKLKISVTASRGSSPEPHETTAALIKQLGGTLGEEIKEPPKRTTQEGKPATQAKAD
jgi:hypothetical protein